jgi:branched-chain amino acid aminotransferase
MAGKYNIQVEKTKNSKISTTNFDTLEFGSVYSDHMFVVDYIDGEWVSPRIVPFQNISMSPATSVLHYGQSIFEGMKAYKNEKNEILLFRPTAHAKRLNKSAERLCIPSFPEELFMEGLTELLKIDEAWIPAKAGNSLYIRPFIYGSDEFIGVRPSKNYKFVIFTGPVAGYYKGNVKVLVETNYVRAAEGGIGFSKSGGNYAASLLPAKLAGEKGYQQILWTDSKEHKYFEESGTMNVMFQIDGKLITPPLSTSILAGITRDSILTVARSWGIPVEERKVSIEEVISALKDGRLEDAFGTGTAAVITHIDAIHYDGKDYELPGGEKRSLSEKIANELTEIKLGHTNDQFDWVYRIKL